MTSQFILLHILWRMTSLEAVSSTSSFERVFQASPSEEDSRGFIPSRHFSLNEKWRGTQKNSWSILKGFPKVSSSVQDVIKSSSNQIKFHKNVDNLQEKPIQNIGKISPVGSNFKVIQLPPHSRNKVSQVSGFHKVGSNVLKDDSKNKVSLYFTEPPLQMFPPPPYPTQNIPKSVTKVQKLSIRKPKPKFPNGRTLTDAEINPELNTINKDDLKKLQSNKDHSAIISFSKENGGKSKDFHQTRQFQKVSKFPKKSKRPRSMDAVRFGDSRNKNSPLSLKHNLRNTPLPSKSKHFRKGLESRTPNVKKNVLRDSGIVPSVKKLSKPPPSFFRSKLNSQPRKTINVKRNKKKSKSSPPPSKITKLRNLFSDASEPNDNSKGVKFPDYFDGFEKERNEDELNTPHHVKFRFPTTEDESSYSSINPAVNNHATSSVISKSNSLSDNPNTSFVRGPVFKNHFANSDPSSPKSIFPSALFRAHHANPLSIKVPRKVNPVHNSNDRHPVQVPQTQINISPKIPPHPRNRPSNPTILSNPSVITPLQPHSWTHFQIHSNTAASSASSASISEIEPNSPAVASPSLSSHNYHLVSDFHPSPPVFPPPPMPLLQGFLKRPDIAGSRAYPNLIKEVAQQTRPKTTDSLFAATEQVNEIRVRPLEEDLRAYRKDYEVKTNQKSSKDSQSVPPEEVIQSHQPPAPIQVTDQQQSSSSNKPKSKKSYEYHFIVKDPDLGLEYGHKEKSRTEGSTEGEYFVTLKDGRTQFIRYVSDDHGYRADVKFFDAKNAALKN